MFVRRFLLFPPLRESNFDREEETERIQMAFESLQKSVLFDNNLLMEIVEPTVLKNGTSCLIDFSLT